eukprot:CAMPEP_0113900130 /NCGR_PEP_ID=MMETSP0780_2-20120614/20481_1 /TAXON_ID=652834 /ORGANISM="Palpitomonas bilix" /LENGTH=65 /DNA_ID=CAMNT_0000892505 /DNA_START=12 /DNA_END=206 /DNA_ORIENTATION=- /assembly_acc=CAM_ASM_000599
MRAKSPSSSQPCSDVVLISMKSAQRQAESGAMREGRAPLLSPNAPHSISSFGEKVEMNLRRSPSA